MTEIKFEKVRVNTNKLVTKIQNLCDRTGKPGTLKEFKDFRDAENLGGLFWEHGLTTTHVSDLLKEINHLKREKQWSKIQPKLPSLSRKLQSYASENETVKNLKKVLDAAIERVPDIKDFDTLTILIDTMANITRKIVITITDPDPAKRTLKSYPIRNLVKDMEAFGQFLKEGGLKTNQIRKFLDTVNNIKLELNLKIKDKGGDAAILISDFPKIDAELVLLKQKIAYASAKKSEVKPLKEVMDAAIDKVQDSEDFERFFQMVESIIAYHKYAGGE
jgi:CRISPR-associated protein Csm2